MTPPNQTTPTPPINTPATRLRALFSDALAALAQLADVMATWSWWRVLALSLLLFIAGSIIDDYLFTSTSSTKKTVSVDTSDRRASKTKKADEKVFNFPEDIKNGKVTVRIDKDGIKVDRVGETSVIVGAPSVPSVSTPTSTAPEAPITPDAPKISSTNESKTTESKTIETTIAVEDDDEDSSDFERKIERAIERAICGPESEKKSGANCKTKIHFETNTSSDTASPFKAIAFMMSLAMWNSKIIGGSRLREQAATVRANVATASLQSQSLERQIAEAKLLRMQAQVEPHFLFNTLAALERLIETNPTRALAMSQALSQWLRALLPQMKEGQSTLGQEVTLVQNYLQLMQMRMGERLAFFIDVPENLRSQALPTMLLQPLVENSIKHGLEPKRAGGEIRIKARRLVSPTNNGADRNSDVIELVVEDTGVGFSANPGSGNGLSNLRERLDLIYGGQAMVSVVARGTLNQIADDALSGTIITIKIPVPKIASMI